MMMSVLEQDPVQLLARVRKGKRGDDLARSCRAEVEVIIGDTPTRITDKQRLEVHVPPGVSVIDWFEKELAPQFVQSPVRAQVIDDETDTTLYFDSRFMFDCFAAGSAERFENLDQLSDIAQYEFAQSVALDYFGPRRVPSHFRRRQAILVRVHSLIKRHWLRFAWTRLMQRASPSRKVNERLLDLLSRNFARSRRLRCLREVFQAWSSAAAAGKRRHSLVGRLVSKATFTQKNLAFQALFRNALRSKMDELVYENHPVQAVQKLISGAKRDAASQGVLSPQSIVKYLMEQHLDVEGDLVNRIMRSPVKAKEPSGVECRPSRGSSARKPLRAPSRFGSPESSSGTRCKDESGPMSTPKQALTPRSPFPDSGGFVSASPDSTSSRAAARAHLASRRRAANGKLRRASPLSVYLLAQNSQRSQGSSSPQSGIFTAPEYMHPVHTPVSCIGSRSPARRTPLHSSPEQILPEARMPLEPARGAIVTPSPATSAYPTNDGGRPGDSPGESGGELLLKEDDARMHRNVDILGPDVETAGSAQHPDDDASMVSCDDPAFAGPGQGVNDDIFPEHPDTDDSRRKTASSLSSGDSALSAWRQEARGNQARARGVQLGSSFSSDLAGISSVRDSLGPLANGSGVRGCGGDPDRARTQYPKLGHRGWHGRGAERSAPTSRTPLSAGLVSKWQVMSSPSSANSYSSQETYQVGHAARGRNLSAYEIPETPGPESDSQSSSFASPALASSAASFNKRLKLQEQASQSSVSTTTTASPSTSGVVQLLQGLGLDRFVVKFVEEDLTDLSLLVKMCIADKREFKETLREMGIRKIGQRERIIRALLEEHENGQETASRKSTSSRRSTKKKKRRKGIKFDEPNVVRALQDSHRREAEATRKVTYQSQAQLKKISKQVLQTLREPLSAPRAASYGVNTSAATSLDTSKIKQARPSFRPSGEVEAFRIRCNLYRRLGLKV